MNNNKFILSIIIFLNASLPYFSFTVDFDITCRNCNFQSQFQIINHITKCDLNCDNFNQYICAIGSFD